MMSLMFMVKNIPNQFYDSTGTFAMEDSKMKSIMNIFFPFFNENGPIKNTFSKVDNLAARFYDKICMKKGQIKTSLMK